MKILLLAHLLLLLACLTVFTDWIPSDFSGCYRDFST